jgi:hypothetical protein
MLAPLQICSISNKNLSLGIYPKQDKNYQKENSTPHTVKVQINIDLKNHPIGGLEAAFFSFNFVTK